MPEKEKKILTTIEKLMPRMTETEKAQLLGYGEGLAARENREQKEEVTE